MAENLAKGQEFTCKLCKHVVIPDPVTCIVCDSTYHEGCAKKSNGTFVGKADYVCKKCDNEYFSEIRHLVESDTVSEETKNVMVLLVKIIESKDEIISSKNYYIKLLQNKVANLESKVKMLNNTQ